MDCWIFKFDKKRKNKKKIEIGTCLAGQGKQASKRIKESVLYRLKIILTHEINKSTNIREIHAI